MRDGRSNPYPTFRSEASMRKLERNVREHARKQQESHTPPGRPSMCPRCGRRPRTTRGSLVTLSCPRCYPDSVSAAEYGLGETRDAAVRSWNDMVKTIKKDGL